MAAANRAPTSSDRNRADPAPPIPARRVNPASTPTTVSEAVGDGACRLSFAKPAQPTPSRPCRSSPESHAVTGAISSSAVRASSSAIAETISYSSEDNRIFATITGVLVPTGAGNNEFTFVTK